MNYETIIVLDFFGHGNHAMAKQVRNFNVFSEILPSDMPRDEIKEKNARGYILIGDATADAGFVAGLGAPVLDAREVEPTEDELKVFLRDTCACSGDYTVSKFSKDIVDHVRAVIGDKKALCAMSGGVDSSVSAVITHKAIGQNLTCIFVDTGLMRLNEGDEVIAAYREKLGMNVIRVDAESRFLSKLAGVTEPEQKRKIIGEEFIRVFEEEAKKIGAVDFLIQGTIYPDIVESASKNRAPVKSHHNVGGLPDVINFEGIVEPVRDLFKDEVRKVGLELGIPEPLLNRQPFPGPGLGVRVIGEVTKQKLDILRQADHIFRDEIYKCGLSGSIWQYFAILTGLKSVGVKDGQRTYGHVIALRAIHSVDAMQADWVGLPYEVLLNASSRITAAVPEINRVVYDITSKPPATIEWE